MAPVIMLSQSEARNFLWVSPLSAISREVDGKWNSRDMNWYPGRLALQGGELACYTTVLALGSLTLEMMFKVLYFNLT